MGACFSTMDKVSDSTSSHIDSKLSEEERHEHSLHKLLFLGPGGSGKSTIFLQLQWLHNGGITDHDRLEFKRCIDLQVIQQMQTAINCYLSDVSECDESLKNSINRIISYDDASILTSEIANHITYIWQNDNRLKDIFHKYDSNKTLEESTQYLWNSLDRISKDDYIPNKTDIINVRNVTTGIDQKKFRIKEVNFHIFDVGGQKCERKKWFHCFDNVRSVVFVVSLSSYNEMMFEDNDTNAMVDALKLFDDTIHREVFLNTPIILFLNKKDLFETKIKNIPITSCPAFADFNEEDPNDYVQTSSYIQREFEEVNKTEQRQIFSHLTCAMDQENIENVFDDIVDIVLKEIRENCRVML